MLVLHYHLLLAILLFMPNLLASIANDTITLHISGFVRSKGCLAFIGGINQCLFIEKKPLVTQALKQVGLTLIGLAYSMSKLIHLFLSVFYDRQLVTGLPGTIVRASTEPGTRRETLETNDLYWFGPS